MQSALLTKFYQEYLQWLEAGAPNYKPFSRSCGLCSNLNSFSFQQGINNQKLSDEMSDQFKREGLSSTLPFNDSMQKSYAREMKEGTQYLNPDRIKWVKDHANPKPHSEKL